MPSTFLFRLLSDTVVGGLWCLEVGGSIAPGSCPITPGGLYIAIRSVDNWLDMHGKNTTIRLHLALVSPWPGYRMAHKSAYPLVMKVCYNSFSSPLLIKHHLGRNRRMCRSDRATHHWSSCRLHGRLNIRRCCSLCKITPDDNKRPLIRASSDGHSNIIIPNYSLPFWWIERRSETAFVWKTFPWRYRTVTFWYRAVCGRGALEIKADMVRNNLE